MKSVCSFYGAIRLLPEGDCVGIPVFSHHADNYLYVGETDSDQVISRFVPFLDAEHYAIDTSVTACLTKTRFALGEQIQIPFWKNGRPAIVDGGITLDSFDERYPNLGSEDDVLRALRNIVRSTREGVYRKRQESVDFEIFREEYRDVFIDPPSSTKYWVSRFRLSAQRIQSNPRFNTDIARDSLRATATEWLSKLFYKGELRFLVSILQAATPEVVSREEARHVLFEQIIGRLLDGHGVPASHNTYLDIQREYFPEGIYHYLRDEHDFNRFTGDHRPLIDPSLVQPMSHMELESTFRGLFGDLINARRYKDAYFWTVMFFGGADAPVEVSDAFHRRLRDTINVMHRELEWVFKHVLSVRSEQSIWRTEARRVLRQLRDTELMCRIVHPDQRFEPADLNRLPVAKDVVESLKLHAGEGRIGRR